MKHSCFVFMLFVWLQNPLLSSLHSKIRVQYIIHCSTWCLMKMIPSSTNTQYLKARSFTSVYIHEIYNVNLCHISYWGLFTTQTSSLKDVLKHNILHVFLCSFGETNSEIAIVKDSVIHPHENISKNPSGK